MDPRRARQAKGAKSVACCPYYHEAIELIGKRWTGAILGVLLNAPAAEGGLRFSEIAQAVPELSDRLLSERMKELEGRGVVERTVISGPPVHVEYRLTEMGRALQPALNELRDWARQWLDEADEDSSAPAPARATAATR
ncbi:MAG TPA: helix-turn-helix domain-containing protein [Solirubrobacteraceae bacterium]|nr:helix-turn-helix domain-containing protein [Solirubrobacteraceae bacterium]